MEVFWIKIASREQFLDDYEISRLLCDSDDSEDDGHSDDDIGPSGSEDAVEEDLDYDIDSVYVVADNRNHGEPENTNDEHSETEESTDKERNVFKARTLPGAEHLPKLLELAERT